MLFSCPIDGGSRSNFRLIAISLLIVSSSLSIAEDATIAVATNFLPTAKKLAKEFELEEEYELKLVGGSTGQLFAQISQGAPFHAFMSADQERVSKLVESELALADTQFTYARGRLCFLVSPNREHSETPKKILHELLFTQIAIANPRTAPYGAAAVEVLAELGLEEQALSSKLITAQNVGQAYAMVSTGNSDFGIVALSSVLNDSVDNDQYYLIPYKLHGPIRQDAVLLKRGSNNHSAKRFLEFLSSREGKAIIRGEGYRFD